MFIVNFVVFQVLLLLRVLNFLDNMSLGFFRVVSVLDLFLSDRVPVDDLRCFFLRSYSIFMLSVSLYFQKALGCLKNLLFLYLTNFVFGGPHSSLGFSDSSGLAIGFDE